MSVLMTCNAAHLQNIARAPQKKIIKNLIRLLISFSYTFPSSAYRLSLLEPDVLRVESSEDPLLERVSVVVCAGCCAGATVDAAGAGVDGAGVVPLEEFVEGIYAGNGSVRSLRVFPSLVFPVVRDRSLVDVAEDEVLLIAAAGGIHHGFE